jgi:hypothetical protein
VSARAFALLSGQQFFRSLREDQRTGIRPELSRFVQLASDASPGAGARSVTRAAARSACSFPRIGLAASTWQRAALPGGERQSPRRRRPDRWSSFTAAVRSRLAGACVTRLPSRSPVPASADDRVGGLASGRGLNPTAGWGPGGRRRGPCFIAEQGAPPSSLLVRLSAQSTAPSHAVGEERTDRAPVRLRVGRPERRRRHSATGARPRPKLIARIAPAAARSGDFASAADESEELGAGR